MFLRDLEYLRQRFSVMSLDGNFSGDGKKQRAVLTFDDGFKECYTNIAPVLEEFGFGAVFFVNTDFCENRKLAYRSKISLCIEALAGSAKKVFEEFNRRFGTALKDFMDLKRFMLTIRADRLDLLEEICAFCRVDGDEYARSNRPYMNSEQIKSLSERGFIIGSHGKDHSDLQLQSFGEIETQMVESCEKVKDITGVSPVPFSFPFGMNRLDRKQLTDFAGRNPVIGKMYGIKGLKIEPPFIHRICLDDPSGDDFSTIPKVMKDEYLLQAQRKLTGR